MSTPYLNMNLPVPTATPGPDWAEDLNTALEVVDDHDHTSGKGRLITSAALNINDDVAINNFNLMLARSFNMANQSAAISGSTDLRCIYAVGGELYYTDGAGNQVQITSGGALNAASIGGIGGDYATSTASVYYNSIAKTFYFDQDTNKRAKLDIGDLTIRETATSANGITIKSPNSLSASYSLTLPTALPAGNRVRLVDSSGVESFGYISTSLIDPAGLGNAAFAANSVSTSNIQDSSITAAKIASAAGVLKLVKTQYTSSTVVDIPTGLTEIAYRGCGGGGGGGYGSVPGSANSGGGGGAGSFPISGFAEVTPSTSKTFATSDVDTGTETITVTSHGFSENQVVRFTSTVTLPAGITAGTAYYLKNVAASTFQISTTKGGSAVNLTSQGSGTHTVTTCYALTIGTAGAAGVYGVSNGTAGTDTVFTNGVGKVFTAKGAPGGTGGAASGVVGVGGSSANYWAPAVPGANGSTGGAAASAGTDALAGNYGGAGGAVTTADAGSGGGGGGSIGLGGAGGRGATSVGGEVGIVGGTGGYGAGGGGGGSGTGTNAGANGGAGGPGFFEIVYWANVNP